MKYSGIGGQAVMEGVMMQNKDTYAVAVRKPDHEIDQQPVMPKVPTPASMRLSARKCKK